MADIINLRLVRKARSRSAAESKAEANRALFGMTKAERAAVKREQADRNRQLDGAKRDD